MSNHETLWTRRARKDLDEIADYISQDNVAHAEKWVLALLQDVERAARYPFAGRKVPELSARAGDFREVFRGTYRIVYEVEEQQITIRAIFEGHSLLKLDE